MRHAVAITKHTRCIYLFISYTSVLFVCLFVLVYLFVFIPVGMFIFLWEVLRNMLRNLGHGQG